MNSLIEDGARVLFQGDSITDAGRVGDGAEGMGRGYAMMAASWFSARFPAKRVEFVNRGISGNRARDLVGRWDKDCLALRPDWVSIMIGINDTWRRYDNNDATSAADYEADYRRILTDVREKLDARLILLEPFVLPVPEDRKTWREDLDPKLEIVRRLANEFQALLVPLDDIFSQAVSSREPAFWAADGVHPSLPGHALIAQSWLRAVEAV